MTVQKKHDIRTGSSDEMVAIYFSGIFLKLANILHPIALTLPFFPNNIYFNLTPLGRHIVCLMSVGIFGAQTKAEKISD